MAKKHQITVKEEKINLKDFRIFDLSFVRQWLGVVVFSTFDLRVFNKTGALLKFLESFREKDKSCYILFSSFGGTHGASAVDIDKILDLGPSYLSLAPIPPDKWSEKVVYSSPNQIYFLLLNDGTAKVPEIFEKIDSIDTWCYFIFAGEQKKEELYAQIRELRNKNLLCEAAIYNLGLDIVRYRIGKYGAEDQFRIFTRRFNAEEIRRLVLNSVEAEKFEVIVK